MQSHKRHLSHPSLSKHVRWPSGAKMWTTRIEQRLVKCHYLRRGGYVFAAVYLNGLGSDFQDGSARYKEQFGGDPHQRLDPGIS